MLKSISRFLRFVNNQQKGWHETYTDKYGRETIVDIDVEVYGEDTAPVLKVGWGKVRKNDKDCMFMLDCNPPIDTLMKAKTAWRKIDVYL